MTFVLLLASFLCLVFAALGVSVNRVSLLASGLALFVLVPLIAAWPGR